VKFHVIKLKSKSDIQIIYINTSFFRKNIKYI